MHEELQWRMRTEFGGEEILTWQVSPDEDGACRHEEDSCVVWTATIPTSFFGRFWNERYAAGMTLMSLISLRRMTGTQTTR